MLLHKIYLLSFLLLGGCSLLRGEEDAVTVSPLPKIENQFQPAKIWSASVGDGVGEYYSHLQPAWRDSLLFAADRKGRVSALDINNGKLIWQVNLSEKQGIWSKNGSALLSGGVTVAGDRLYIGSEKAVVYALNAADGQTLWQRKVAGEAISRPVVSDGLVLIHTTNGMLQALNESDGTIKWSLHLDTPALSLRGESAPAIAFGAAIVGGDNGRVSAVLLEQGRLIWQQRIAQITGATEIDRLSDVDITPVVSKGVVYALAYNGSLSALELRSGQLLWKRAWGSVNDFIVEAGRIYLVDKNDRIMALKADGGTLLWSQNELLHRKLTAAVMYKGWLVVGDAGGYLHWMNSDDGRFVVQQAVDRSGLLNKAVVAGDKLILHARNGKIHAFTR